MCFSYSAATDSLNSSAASVLAYRYSAHAEHLLIGRKRALFAHDINRNVSGYSSSALAKQKERSHSGTSAGALPRGHANHKFC